MRIKLFDALKILGKHFQAKMGITENYENAQVAFATSLQVSLAAHISSAKRDGWITEDNYVLLDELDARCTRFFATCPMVNLPMGRLTVTVTAKDIRDLLDDLKAHADVDEVICLPCQR